MNGILLKLNDILEEAEGLLKGLKRKEDDLNASHILLSKGHEELKSKLSEFSQREADIVPIENIQVVKKELDAKSLQIQEELSKLVSDRKEFEDYKQGENQRLSNLRLQTQTESNNLDIQRKNINEQIEKGINDWTSKFLKKG